MLQKRNISAVWEVRWVWHPRVLMEEENSPCLPLRPTQWGFQMIRLPSTKSSNVVGEKGVSMPGLNTAPMSKCVFSQLNCMSSRSDTWYLLVSKSWAPHWGVLRFSSPLSPLGSEWLELVADDYPKNLAFEAAAIAIELGTFLMSWLLNFGQDLSLQ